MNMPYALAAIPEAEPDAVGAVREALERDGVVRVRGVVPRARVQAARTAVLDHLAGLGRLAADAPRDQAIPADGSRGVPLMGHGGINAHPRLRAVTEAPELFRLFRALFGEPALTYRHKWLRAVGHERFTGVHTDRVYMGRGSGRVHVCWLPLDDLDVAEGTPRFVLGSHSDPAYRRLHATYGRLDVDRDRINGWLTTDPTDVLQWFGGRWAGGSMRMGDALIFGLDTVHCTGRNRGGRYRISCDVRFQPAREPVDPRWRGLRPVGHIGAPPAGESVPWRNMTEAKQAWGLTALGEDG